jgi:curli production assembly/transport component CsgG
LAFNSRHSRLAANNVFSEPYFGADLGARKYFTSQNRLSPYVGLGGGMMTYYKNRSSLPKEIDGRVYPTANGEAGLDYRFSKNIGIQLGFDYRYLLKDGVDGVTKGSINDQQWNISAGITFKPVIFKNIFK